MLNYIGIVLTSDGRREGHFLYESESKIGTESNRRDMMKVATRYGHDSAGTLILTGLAGSRGADANANSYQVMANHVQLVKLEDPPPVEVVAAPFGG